MPAFGPFSADVDSAGPADGGSQVIRGLPCAAGSPSSAPASLPLTLQHTQVWWGCPAKCDSPLYILRWPLPWPTRFVCRLDSSGIGAGQLCQASAHILRQLCLNAPPAPVTRGASRRVHARL